MAVNRKLLQVCFLAMGIGLCLNVQAGLFDRLAFFRGWFSKNRVESLIVTGNYANSRLLAEVLQQETKQPILLLSLSAQGNMEFYFMPSGTEAMALDPNKYVEFVDYLQPKQVVFLGDKQYTGESYVDMLRGRYPTVRVNSEDWQKNAEALALMFKRKKLPKKYIACVIKLMMASGRAANTPAANALPGSSAEPMFLPRTVLPAQ